MVSKATVEMISIYLSRHPMSHRILPSISYCDVRTTAPQMESM
jgi:hypothetical protein